MDEKGSFRGVRFGMRGARAFSMHPLSFLTKRTHLSVTATGRKMFARVPLMTPARFDFLYLLHEAGRQYAGTLRGKYLPTPVAQTELRRRLGLARQTIWKMAVRLEELGLIERGADPADRQGRVQIWLTDDGCRLIRRAYGAAFTERYPLPPEAVFADEEARRAVHRVIRDEIRAKTRVASTFAGMKFEFLSDAAKSLEPAKVGREVAKIFNAYVWKHTRPGRHRHGRYMDLLDRSIANAGELARAFGDESEDLLYELNYSPYA